MENLMCWNVQIYFFSNLEVTKENQGAQQDVHHNDTRPHDDGGKKTQNLGDG